MTNRYRAALLALVAASFLFVHLRALPRTLEDIDSVNLALGVESFEVAEHRPHPPGYPVFIAMAKASTAAAAIVAPSLDRDRRAAVGLAIWNVLAGSVAIVAIARLWTAIGLSPLLSLLAALVAITSPIFWFTAARPLTDTFGLVAAIVVQTALLAGLARRRSERDAVPASWFVAAAACGLLVGVRSQTVWLCAPLLLVALLSLVARHQWRPAVTMAACAMAGVLAWAIPMVIDTGGWRAYLRAFASQRDQDLSGIELLATMPGHQLFKDALWRTFGAGWYDATFAQIVLGLACVGLIATAWRQRRQLALVALAFLPYLIFHLVFQETVTLRYALPLVVPVAGFAVLALARAGTRTAAVLACVISAVSLYFGQPPLEAYARDTSPVFRAFQQMQTRVRGASDTPFVHMHHQVWLGVRRAADWYSADFDIDTRTFPGDREWTALVDRWRSGDTRTAWLLADPKRNDVSLFDWRGRRLAGDYKRAPESRALIGGTRLEDFLWWTLPPPGWMLGRGWSVTPEIAGMTWKDGDLPSVRPARAFLRRTGRPMTVVLGGRYLRGHGAAVVTVSVDGHTVDEWSLQAAPERFVRWISLPAGSLVGEGAYAALTVSVRSAAPGAPVPEVGLEDFDAAADDDRLFARDLGWHEPEQDATTGRLWRWTEGRATLVARTGTRDTHLLISGESPLRYFPKPSTVVVLAGDRELARFTAAADFSEAVAVPANALAASGGRITIETDSTFVPAERGESADRRILGLRIYQLEVR